MKKFVLSRFALLIIGLLFIKVATCQNLETLFVEKMDGASLVFPEECSPDDMVILINSSLPNLKFESNMLPSDAFKVIYNEKDNQYFICHEKMKFKLTVSGPNLQSEDIDVFEIDKPLAYRVSANIAKGIVNILSNPRNSTVIFPDLNNLVLSSNQPITNVSGKYRVNIVKAQYKNIDTTIIIPRDAEKTYNIDLVPLFARIKLDLRTNDNSQFLKAPILWIDSTQIVLDALVKQGQNLRSFFDDVEFYKFYEGGIIPIKEGLHKIKIMAESYVPYESTIDVKDGKLYNLAVSLEPVFGYLTFIDKQLADGATIILDNQKIGNVPMFKYKSRVGSHNVRIEKSGYLPILEDSIIVVNEKKITDVEVSMLLARKINFQSDPSHAEIIVGGNRIGFTPVSAILNEGNHEILIRKNGFATEKMVKQIGVQTPEEENVSLKLRAVNILNIVSEKKGLQIQIEGKDETQNIAIEQQFTTPAEIPLPYGTYQISLKDDKKIYYKSNINHSPQIKKRGIIPCYSPSSFHILEANIGINQKSGNLGSIKSFSDINNFEATLGRFVMFPKTGLSTAILNIDYRVIQSDSLEFKTIAPNILLLNWDWRIGGSILRQVDVNLLGRFKYTPGLKFLDLNIPGLADVEMLNYFYGLEFSTRLSVVNINFRTGMQVFDGKLNYWDSRQKKYGYVDKQSSRFVEESLPLPRINKQWVGSIGITFNGRVHGSNYMLRLWNKPLLDPIKRKSRIANSEMDKPQKQNFFGKLKFWGKTN